MILAPQRSEKAMFRAFAMALGISALVLGVEALAVDRLYFKEKPAKGAQQQQANAFGQKAARPSGTKEYIIPEWAPWSLLSAGAVTVLYTVTIAPNAGGGGGGGGDD